MVSETKGDFFERDPIFPGISEFYFPIGSGGAIAELSNAMKIKQLCLWPNKYLFYIFNGSV